MDVAAVAQVATGVVSLLLAALALRVALQQLRPLRHELAKLQAEDERRQTLKSELPGEVRRLEGFDPRLTNWDWNKLLSLDGNTPTQLLSRLSPSYSAFHGDLDRGFPHDAVIIVDLLFVPHLLKSGLIAPLSSDNGLDLNVRLERRARLLGVQLG